MIKNCAYCNSEVEYEFNVKDPRCHDCKNVLTRLLERLHYHSERTLKKALNCTYCGNRVVYRRKLSQYETPTCYDCRYAFKNLYACLSYNLMNKNKPEVYNIKCSICSTVVQRSKYITKATCYDCTKMKQKQYAKKHYRKKYISLKEIRNNTNKTVKSWLNARGGRVEEDLKKDSSSGLFYISMYHPKTIEEKVYLPDSLQSILK